MLTGLKQELVAQRLRAAISSSYEVLGYNAHAPRLVVDNGISEAVEEFDRLDRIFQRHRLDRRKHQ